MHGGPSLCRLERHQPRSTAFDCFNAPIAVRIALPMSPCRCWPNEARALPTPKSETGELCPANHRSRSAETVFPILALVKNGAGTVTLAHGKR